MFNKKLTIKSLWRRSGVFIVNFEQVNVSWVVTKYCGVFSSSYCETKHYKEILTKIF